MDIDAYLLALTEWGRFANDLRMHGNTLGGAYPDKIVAAALASMYDIPTTQMAYRARILSPGRVAGGQIYTAFEMGAPPASIASAGRLNPKGVAYLYMASSLDTAMAEVRPTTQDVTCVAELVPLRPLRVVNLTATNTMLPGHEDLRVVSRMFSQPVTNRKDIRRYEPTQYIAGAIKNSGVDGIRYESSVRVTGHNIVVFDVNAFCIGRVVQFP